MIYVYIQIWYYIPQILPGECQKSCHVVCRGVDDSEERYFLHWFCYSYQAQSSGRAETDVFILGVVDLNVPGAKSSDKIMEISQCIQFINDLAPDRHVCLLEMSEHAKRSSKRGISDEEREVEEALWSLRQHLDTRWMMPFSLHPSAEQQSNRRCAWSQKK